MAEPIKKKVLNWDLIKTWCNGLFALIGHTHKAADVTDMAASVTNIINNMNIVSTQGNPTSKTGWLVIGNILIQYGQNVVGEDSTIKVTLSKAFSNTNYAITTSSTGSEGSYTNGHSINTVTTSSFKVWNTCAGSITIRWIAIGVVSAKHLLKQLCDLFVLKEVKYV